MVGVDPWGRLEFGVSVAHADAPARAVEGVVVPPAEERAVVGVGGAAARVFEDVVGFAPGRVDGATGDDAATVAEHDRLALGGDERALDGVEAEDSAVSVVDETEDLACGGGMERAGSRDARLEVVGDAGDRCGILAGGEGVRGDGDHEGGSGAGKARRVGEACGEGEDAGERVVAALGAGASWIAWGRLGLPAERSRVVGARGVRDGRPEYGAGWCGGPRSRRSRFGVAGVVGVGAGRVGCAGLAEGSGRARNRVAVIGAGTEIGVPEKLELGGCLRQEHAVDRDQAVASSPEGDAAAVFGGFGRAGAVGVEDLHPRLRVEANLVGRGPLPASRRDIGTSIAVLAAVATTVVAIPVVAIPEIAMVVEVAIARVVDS